MRNSDDVVPCSARTVFSLHRNYRTFVFSLATAVLLSACNAFVHDESPPEWEDPPGTAKDVAAIAEGTSGPGAAVFNAKCAVCHQMSGEGIPNVFPSLVGSEFATGDPVIPIRIVLHGFAGPIERNGQKINGIMQPWKNDLSDQEIADVLSFIRSSWGNSATAVTAEQVKEQRELTKAKSGAYTEAELRPTP